MKTISVTPSVLEHTGREIGEDADGYKRLYERLFTEVETDGTGLAGEGQCSIYTADYRLSE